MSKCASLKLLRPCHAVRLVQEVHSLPLELGEQLEKGRHVGNKRIVHSNKAHPFSAGGEDRLQRLRRLTIMEAVDNTATHSPTLTTRTGMTPSGHNDFSPWIPYPLDQPVVPENAVPAFNDRRLNPLEWVELLEQTECLDYVSPDIDACLERQCRMEGNQEIELTGREFIDSPAIPKLPSLNVLSSAERPTILKPITRPQCNVSRRPGLREQFPRQQLLMEHNQAHFPDNYPAAAEQLVQMKRPTRRSSSTAKRGAGNPSSRSASRTLDFEAPLQKKTNARHKRASWGGHSSRAAAAPRRQCKSARKSKDCMIPGCTKGARSRGLCKRHGGGKRCTHPECTRSDQGGGFCIAHGGGKRCATEGCKNSAQSRGLCKSHGGGKRCRAKGCTKSSQAGGFCRGHRPQSVLI
ncbi:hypothetical protein PC116_g8336 [Phytophthora cactorum]|uniref:WRKY19-like zinc finger domain-containing protein n=1 Tax=Phytophthora cactorum TaxID=29920 RepID=A0A8T1L3T5_9STRA|nr:hypothetical protein PC112_g13218 [Phytophthora cactorum]KAG2858219.1 hypothetical protein PC113_g10001 [Phytophthora cactorum]KAG2898451.1 hypothetical protein PC114_g14271 [Phytophthora cactorum]KAG2911420.1 hypothetical protein PC115_g12572 [Phytophthora cactorum]KAG2941077.1 hypothetical protein PC117_g10339 [Phytophthora cactorum]